MRKLFQNFKKSESGATLVEYGVALIVAILVGGAALTTLAGGVSNNMSAGCSSLDVTAEAGGDGTGCTEVIADPV